MLHLTKKATIVFSLILFAMIGCVSSALADENETSSQCERYKSEQTA